MPTYAGINGVVRKLKEWTVGINGVVHQQKEVWSGVSGVSKQIFSKVKNVNLHISGSGGPIAGGYAKVTVNGEVYYSSAELQIQEGSTVKIDVNCTRQGYYEPGAIQFNGAINVSTTGTDESGFPLQTFSFNANSEAYVNIGVYSASYPYIYYYGRATITGGT